MSAEYEGKDPLALAQEAERDLNSRGAKQGHNSSDSGPSSPRPPPNFPLLTLPSNRIRRRSIRNRQISRQRSQGRLCCLGRRRQPRDSCG